MPEKFVSHLAKLLGDPQRCSIVELLAQADWSVGDLAEETGLHTATVSHHLQQLKQAGLAGSRQSGKHRDYFLRTGQLHELVHWLEALSQQREDQDACARRYRELVIRRFLTRAEGVLPQHARQRELILQWFAASLRPRHFYHREELGRMWAAYLPDWESLLPLLEARELISGNGEYYIAVR